MGDTVEARRTPIGPVLAIAGGAVLVIGSFLTWAEVSGGGQTQSVSGTEGTDGWITLVAGLVAVAVGVATFRAARRPLAILVVAVGLVGGGVGLYDALTAKENVISEVAEQSAAAAGASVAEVRTVLDLLFDSGQIGISIGIGLYLVIAGGVVAIAAGLLQLGTRAAAPAMPAATFGAPAGDDGSSPASTDVPPAWSPAPTGGPPEGPSA